MAAYQVVGTSLIVSGKGRKWRVRKAGSLGLVTHEIFPTRKSAVSWANVNRDAKVLT